MSIHRTNTITNCDKEWQNFFKLSQEKANLLPEQVSHYNIIKFKILHSLELLSNLQFYMMLTHQRIFFMLSVCGS